jgi:hypothetical protein
MALESLLVILQNVALILHAHMPYEYTLAHYYNMSCRVNTTKMTINMLPIQRTGGQDEEWSLAMKYMLCNVRFLLAYHETTDSV